MILLNTMQFINILAHMTEQWSNLTMEYTISDYLKIVHKIDYSVENGNNIFTFNDPRQETLFRLRYSEYIQC